MKHDPPGKGFGDPVKDIKYIAKLSPQLCNMAQGNGLCDPMKM
jgi:hypothetical protein